MRTAQGGAAGAKIQHHLTSAFGYKQTSSRWKSKSALPPTADVAAVGHTGERDRARAQRVIAEDSLGGLRIDGHEGLCAAAPVSCHRICSPPRTRGHKIRVISAQIEILGGTAPNAASRKASRAMARAN